MSQVQHWAPGGETGLANARDGQGAFTSTNGCVIFKGTSSFVLFFFGGGGPLKNTDPYAVPSCKCGSALKPCIDARVHARNNRKAVPVSQKPCHEHKQKVKINDKWNQATAPANKVSAAANARANYDTASCGRATSEGSSRRSSSLLAPHALKLQKWSPFVP